MSTTKLTTSQKTAFSPSDPLPETSADPGAPTITGGATATADMTNAGLASGAARPGGKPVHIDVLLAGSSVHFGDDRTYVMVSADQAWIQGGHGDDQVRGSASSSAVLLGNGNNVVRLDGQGNWVWLGSGSNQVTLTGEGNSAFLGAGNNAVTLTGDLGAVFTGGGNDVISITGTGNFVMTDEGDDRIAISGTGNIVNAGGGRDTILLTGGSYAMAGDGDDLLRVQGSGNTVDGGAGNDTIHLSGTEHRIILNAPGDGTDEIHGSIIRGGHLLDLRDALRSTGWDGDPERLADYVTVTRHKGDTLLSINLTGLEGDPTYAIAILNEGQVSYEALLPYMVWA
ncbi:calcium-binding protein [Roseicella aerolata]|uniref:Hemolysin type calcium-binding protein n=1 Tax=Roseicella aerolata TaxID=2883479 RepID=A0A9X1ID86_9PROT|nr:hypothetical protein [Roseicella aerolata]MCB4821864.1 hypothetical protein [Roseicella aerolata]